MKSAYDISDGNNDKRLKPSEQFFVRYKDGKFILPPIEDYKPVGEKPDNSAHGAIQTDTSVSMPFVEPSESQEETWEDVIERFNVEVADKEKTFVTATQLYKWLKINYTITRKW